MYIHTYIYAHIHTYIHTLYARYSHKTSKHRLKVKHASTDSKTVFEATTNNRI